MKIDKKVLAIIQARYNSSRLPGKVLKKIGSKTILEIIFSRIKKSKKINKIIVACSKNPADYEIVKLCKKNNIDYYIGDEKNVLERFYLSAKKYKINNIIRVTADCPLIDYKILDNLIINFFEKKVDYASNTLTPTFPDGLDVEIFSMKALSETYYKAKKSYDKEHVTTYMKNNRKLKKFNLESNYGDFSNYRLTVDENLDLKVLQKIYNLNNKKLPSTYKKIIDLIKLHKSRFPQNLNSKRNEGSFLHEGQKLWKKAKNIISGGSSLFSKNPDLFLPEKWPAYFNKTKGINIWSLDNKKFLDFAFMGVGTNILGYSRKEIDSEVKKIVDKGNLSTLNCKEEVQLAEKLLDMNPWADKARFTRTGGEASAVAIRLARAATGREKIIVCGYHGWHDWYLAANLKNKSNLDIHLMKNVKTNGVPKSLKNDCFSFKYNDFDNLKKIISENKGKISALIMEVERNEKPKNNFLQKVRQITKENNIALIFDECTSGFRETYGGLCKKYNVFPDMIIFGKALGNGYAINSILGIDSIMNSIDQTFISSTFWTERIGYAAALKTLELMEKLQSWKIIKNTGILFKKNWKKISLKNNLKIKVSGIDPIPRFDFDYNNNVNKTFISQEFLKKGYLASNCIYTCIDHADNEKLKNYFSILDEIFYTINKHYDVTNFLESPVCISGFREDKN